MFSSTERDLSLIQITPEKMLVISCDSLGGIGLKEEDKVEVSNQIVGRFTLRVALMELLAVGVEPITIVNNLSVEYENTGKEIIAGIKEELGIIDLDSADLLTGSTEENIETVQTGMGITAIGLAEVKELDLAASQDGDLLVAIGKPKVGAEVLAAAEEIADLKAMKDLRNIDYIHDLLPVGSKGISYEASLLAQINNLKLELKESPLDLDKSAGPATVVLAALEPDKVNKLREEINKPLTVIGKLKSRN